MLGILGWLGILRPGALIEDEEQKLLDQQLSALNAIPDWQAKVSATISAMTQVSVTQIMDMIALLLFQIDSRRGSLPVSHIRYYSDILARLLELLNSTSAAASLTPPAATPATPVVAASASAPAVAPVDSSALELPQIPPDIECPYMTKASAYPPKWNDPAAENRYLLKYPDVTYAVNNKIQPSALWHYRCYGQKEGRTWAGLDGWRGRVNRPGYLK